MRTQIWVRGKRHIALPLALLAAVFIVFTLAQVIGAKEQGTYKIVDEYGDRAVLEDVAIRGSIVDANHRTDFTWQGAEVNTETTIYPHAQHEWRYRYAPGFYERIGDHYYAVHLGMWIQDYSISRHTFRGNKQLEQETATLTVPVAQIEVRDDNSAEYTNTLAFGLAGAGEDTFFTAVTTDGYKGTNGIYKLVYNDSSQYVDPSERQPSLPIMTFSLDANADDNSSTSIAVLGLEAVGDKLALILLKNDALVIEGYSTDGQWLGEAVVSPFALVGNEHTEAENSPKHYEQYEAYSNAESNSLSLSFRSNQGQRTVVSLDFSEEIKLADVTTISTDSSSLREDYDYEHGARFITFKNGRLYYAGAFREVDEDGANYLNAMSPLKFLVHVYEHGEQIYRGELVTDVNDDLIRMQNRSLHDFSYDVLQYRSFFEVRIDA